MKLDLQNRPRLRRWIAFGLGGAFNTAATYVIYLLLHLFWPYQAAYLAAYVTGIGIAYVINARYVFHTPLSWRGILAYPSVYLVQYLVSALLLSLLVERFGLGAGIAPLLVTAIMVPLTYVMSKFVLKTTSRPPNRASLPFGSMTLSAALTLAVMWMPFGFRLTGLIEEWDVLGLFVRDGWFLVAGPGSPLALHAIRPLTILPHAIAFLLTPDSFAAWHALLLVALALKACATGLLVWQATRSRTAAVFASMLILLYPADSMQLSFRGIHIAWSMAAALFACVLLVQSLDKTARSRWACIVGGTMLMLGAMAMYEAAIVFVPLPLAIVYIRAGWRQAWHELKANIAACLTWLSAPVTYVVYAIVIMRSGENYQADVIAGSSPLATVSSNLPKLFTLAMPRIFVGGWIDAWHTVRQDYATHVWWAIAVAVLVAALFLLARNKSDTPVAARSVGTRLFLVGILFAALGYAPYLTSGAHILISQRTYLFASLGAVFAWAALVRGWNGRPGTIAWCVGAILVGAGLSYQWVQFHHYVSLSRIQQNEIAAMTSRFDGQTGNRPIVIADESDYIGQDWMFPRKTLPLLFTYVYGHDFGPIEVCHMGTGEWYRSDDGGRHGRCGEDAQGWHFDPPPSLKDAPSPLPSLRFPHDDVAVVTVPRGLALSEARTAMGGNKRLENLLADRSPGRMERMFRDTASPMEFHWSFGRYWSMDEPIHGTGWRPAEWVIGMRRSHAAAWKTAEAATLDFTIQPTPGPYRLTGRIGQSAPGVGPTSIELRLNDLALPLHWEDDTRFVAEVPPSALRNGDNRLRFQAPVNPDYYGLSFQLSRVDISPKRH